MVITSEELHDSKELHSPYPEEFKARMVELVRVGRSPNEVAEEFESSSESIRQWAKQADLDEGNRADGLTTKEKDEIRAFRKQVKRREMEREILSKAAAWFAREGIGNSTGLLLPRQVLRSAPMAP